MDKLFEQKEFAQLRYKPGEKLAISSFHAYTQQLFAARWMASNTRSRCFFKHYMGSGKTIGSLLSASENHKLYQFLGYGRVIIIGFQKETFMREILHNPGLGYIAQEEYKKLIQYSKNQSDYGKELYRKYKNYLRKKITDITQNGYVKFIGYQELYNSLFIDDKVNDTILNFFKDSFVICDEIHNVYNSVETNTYGKALQYIFDHYGDSIKVILMSGTPINNKPSEIIDVLNLLTGKKLSKHDFFSEDEKLLPGALSRIREISEGYFSFYINEDISLMPEKIYEGDHKLEFLNFTLCKLTGEHAKIIKGISIGIDDHNIFDAYFPLSKGFFYKNIDFALLKLEKEEWRQKIGLHSIEGTVTGPLLHYDNIGQYSIKYKKMIEQMNCKGKVIIYHEYVNGTGVKLIEQILLANGVLPKNGFSNANTKCSICFKIAAEHIDHEFVPLKFLSIYGEMDKQTITENLTIFNSSQNKEGSIYKFIICSSMVREGYNFTCVRHLWIMHLLPHISALLQLLARPVRVFSHKDLPPEDRNVTIRIFACEEEIQRYSKKIQNFKVIQQIDRVINENAIDVSFYHDIIKKSFSQDNILPFPEKKKIVRVDYTTYNALYGEWEVEEIKKIIVSLFMRTSIWTYDELWATVKDSPFEQIVDGSLFDENNFVLALGDLIYGHRTLPIIKDGQRYKIASIYNGKTYYTIFPLQDSEHPIGRKLEFLEGVPQITPFSWIQPPSKDTNVRVNITPQLMNLNMNYDEMKKKFIQKFYEANSLEIPVSTEIYTQDFHIHLIKDAISYIFDIYTRRSTQSEYHEFYFKIIHFYTRIDMVIYAKNLPEKYSVNYDKYTSGEADELSNISDRSSTISTFDISEINAFLKTNKQVSKDLLPVGHYMNVEPELYGSNGWYIAPDLLKEEADVVENDFIIGYYEKTPNSIEFRFKLRKPKHLITTKEDKRELELGMACESKQKHELKTLCKKLNISPIGTAKNICQQIKEFLIYQELMDRKNFKKGKIARRTRWIYLAFEKQSIF